ncbi:MAG TPA: precorrin-3B C(17)-methyltransferase [Rhodospirillales bacterium]|nr:precorrin-3B C(17)-methyltransferase [Rhodospirillales bacterium]
MTGALFGLGIGPGDPDLITLKARDILARVPVIAYPAPDGGDSLVRAIAAPHVPAGRIEIAIATPMAIDRYPAREVYDRYAAILGEHLAAGRDVAVLCEGDPFFYGSFMYIFERLAGAYPAVVVPGVSSLAAVAAAAGLPLVSRNEVLSVLPAPLPEADLESRLARVEAAAIMKVGRHLPKVRRVLARLGLDAGAMYVERASMANQRVLPLADAGDGEAPYFSMILARRAARDASAAGDGALPAGAALIALDAGGLALARRLQPRLPASIVHGLAGRTDGADRSFTGTMAHLRALFAAGTPIVGICAAGILVRAVAPLLADKEAEPPVVAVAGDGSVAVPLLGGHHGANRLARAIAAALEGVAAITTAGDVRLGVGLDEPPAGWRIADPQAAKAVTAALLAGEPVALDVQAGDASWLTDSGARFASEGGALVLVTDRADPPAAEQRTLVLHPPVLALGVGCERGCAAEELIDLARHTLAAHGLAEAAVACVVSLDLKADEAAVHALADALGVPARFFSAAELEAQAPRLANPSDIVFREVGCHGVAEGAALAAAGADGVLVVEKTRGRRATCAVARAAGNIDARDIDTGAIGRGRGRLSVVGIGPGTPDWRTAELLRTLAAATDVVGYGLYLDLIADLIAGKRRHQTPMSEEEARVRLALDLAAEGRRVALVSSGDAGIYALAALAFELLDREDRPAWNRLAINVVPGITALQAAAARAGAVIGHDFCAISLSDLLTPWEDIERRLRAAAAGDFVVALYNPVSQRRRTQLPCARDILLAARPPATPVVLARNLGRAGETIHVIELKALTPEDVDMLTVVLVGSSRTRLIERGTHRFVYTPRGYASKHQDGASKHQHRAVEHKERAAE